MFARSVDTPLGQLRLVGRESALLGIYFPDHTPPPRYAAPDRDHPILDAAAAQLVAWCAGVRDDFDLPIALEGTPFQQSVWQALLDIPLGETRTYGALARVLGKPAGSARAVGAAVGRNPLSIVVPCHRVVGAKGQLTGFAGGLQRKRWLLARESGVGALFGPR